MGALLLLLFTPQRRGRRPSRIQWTAYTEREGSRGPAESFEALTGSVVGGHKTRAMTASRSAYAVAFWLVDVFRRRGVTL